MNILDRLKELKDEKYALFQEKLLPTVSKERIIGVRVPLVRNLAKELINENGIDTFLNDLPHNYYDEDMLHVLLISKTKDYDECIKQVDNFLPYIDNWAVCDILSPTVFKKNKDKLIGKIKEWVKSTETYTCRFAIEMLMSHFLDDDFKEEYLLIPSKIKSDDYYVNMMIAWFYATALSKRWDATIVYLEKNVLSIWVHNKTIQKARESYRISQTQKDYLNSLKR